MALWARYFGVLLLTLSSGCVSVGTPWTLPQTSFWKKSDATREKQDEWAKNPHRKKSAREEAEESEPLIAEMVDRPHSVPDSKQLQPADIQKLIDEELRDAAPEEREEMLAFLKTVQPSQIPAILKARRIAQDRDPATLAQAETTPESPSQEILPAAHSLAVSSADSTSTKKNPEAAVPAEGDQAEATGEKPTTSASVAANPGWQKKFKSLTDPNWLWPHATAEDGNEPLSGGEKQERTPFGLPQILTPHALRSESNNSPSIAANSTTASVPEKVVTEPVAALPKTAAVESRITPGSALWEDEILKLISLLEADASSSGLEGEPARKAVRQQVALRMLYLVANEPQKALQAIPGLPAEEQEFWTSLFLGLSEYLDRSGTNDPGERATQTIAHLRTAAYHLQQSARLRLRNISFCRQINGFGNYEMFPANEFSPGQTVLIYAEIRNFKSLPAEDGHFVTRIRSTIEIYTGGPEQQLIDRNTFDATEDRSRSLRTDYYHSYRLDLPPHLDAGPHLVKLILQDEMTGKQTTETLHFTVR